MRKYSKPARIRWLGIDPELARRTGDYRASAGAIYAAREYSVG